MEQNSEKIIKVEKAIIRENKEEKAKIDIKENEKVFLKEFHSTQYLKRLKQTTYDGKEVVFVLPNGKEVTV